MNTELISKNGSKAEFSISFTAEEFDEAYKKAFNKNKGKLAVNGFRKGKAPLSIIEKLYGPEIFYEDAINILLDEAYPQSIEELALEPIDYPAVDFKDGELPAKGKATTAIVKVDVVPAVEVKEYKGLKAERTVKTITDEDVEKRLSAIQKQNARLEAVEEAAVEGDTVVIDYAGFVGEEQFEGGTAENHSLKLGSKSFIPGFEDQLVGTKAGDQKDVTVTFPTEYHAPELAGKEAVFKCTVHEVKREILSELNDEFAADVSEFETLADYKESLKKELEEEAKGASEYDGKNKVIEKLIEANPVEVPEKMVANEVENMAAEVEQQFAGNGITLEMYASFMGKSVAEFKESIKPDAANRIKSRLLIEAVAKAEGLEASEEEIEAEFANMAKMYGMTEEDVKKAFGSNLAPLKQDIAMRKAVDFIYNNAEFTDVEEKAE